MHPGPFRSGCIKSYVCRPHPMNFEMENIMNLELRQLIWDRAKKYYPEKASHGLNHIQDNLNKAEKMLEFVKEPFTDQIYAAIVFHDSGLEKHGRSMHEHYSAEIAKKELKDLFNTKDLHLISAAILEHRASFKGKFTSMLSDICSSADRNEPNFEATVARSFLYTTEHHPEFDFETKCDTVAKHLYEKYGTKGYARFPIYYSRYYRNDLREYQRKMDALTGDVVAKVVGNDGKNAEKLYDKALESLSDRKEWKESDIKSVADLKTFYKECLYGMIDYRKKPPVCIQADETSNLDWIFGYKFPSVEDTLKYNCGTCLNAAYVAKHFLTKWGMENKSIFIYPTNKWDLNPQTHCCVLYKQNGKWRLLDSIPEMIDNRLSGSTYKEVAKQVIAIHRDAYNKEMTYALIEKYPEVGDGLFTVLSCMDDNIDGELTKSFGTGLKEAFKIFKTNIFDFKFSASTESLSEQYNRAEESVDEFASESMQDIVSAKKMYFANNNGKIPKDANGNIVLTKNVIDATIYAAFDQFNDSKVAMACKGFVLYKGGTNKHVLVVHGDDSLTEPEEIECTGTIYSVTLSEPIEFRYHGHRGFGKCRLPKVYTVTEEALKDAQIKKEESVEFKATFEYEKSLTMQHATESLSEKIASNIVNDKVYHASPKKLDYLGGKASKTKDAKGSVFVSPFKHFASMFIFDFQAIVDEIEAQIGKKHIKIDNFGFEEWNMTPTSTTSMPSRVHILVRTPESFKSFKGKATGYLYTIDFNKYKDKADMWSHAKDSDVEFIIRSDVHYEKCEEITMEYEVVKDTRLHATEDLDVSATLLQEFNAGIEEFNHWVRDLELKYLKNELNDEQVAMAFEHIAMENILTDTVKTIFRKIGEFIAWFLRKLKDLWNYFFGKTQRATRALKASNDKITRHMMSSLGINCLHCGYRSTQAYLGSYCTIQGSFHWICCRKL